MDRFPAIIIPSFRSCMAVDEVKLLGMWRLGLWLSISTSYLFPLIKAACQLLLPLIIHSTSRHPRDNPYLIMQCVYLCE